MNAMISALGLALAIGGVLVAAVEWFLPAPVQPDRPDTRLEAFVKRTAAKFDRTTWIVVAAAAAVGLVIGVLTGVLLYLFLLPLAVMVGRLVMSSHGHGRQTERLQQLEAWTRSLSGLIISGASLETALMNSLSNAGPLVRPQIERLAARLQAGWATPRALEKLASELDDTTGELVAMHLIMAVRQRGPGLAQALDDLSESVAEEVKIRRKVAADRAAPMRQARIITVATLTLLCVVPMLGGPMEAYQSPTGQVLYFVLTLMTLMLLWMMRKSVEPKVQPRLMQRAPEEEVQA